MEGFVSQLLTSLGTLTLVGILFWAWINARFNSLQKDIDANKERLSELEKRQYDFVDKEDHHDSKTGIESQLQELRKEMRDMPDRIVSMLQKFIK